VLAPVLQRTRALADRACALDTGLNKLFMGPPYGIGILTAGVVLAIMVLPFIAATMRDVFDTVPACSRNRLRPRATTGSHLARGSPYSRAASREASCWAGASPGETMR